MPITFKPLMRFMESNDVSYYFLANQGIDNHTLHRIRHEQPITTDTLGKLCAILHCQPTDIISYEEN